jgi:hypothetical protein
MSLASSMLDFAKQVDLVPLGGKIIHHEILVVSLVKFYGIISAQCVPVKLRRMPIRQMKRGDRF